MPFLLELYAGTREEELAVFDLPPERKEAFLKQQFDAQHSHYTEEFESASFDVITVSGRPIGRLYVDRQDDEIHILDIIIAPERRGAGIGTGIVRDLMAEAREKSVPVRIHINFTELSRPLFERLGFVDDEQTQFGVFIKWQP